ncbi:MAG: aldehyde dehydrogenase [Pseudomonadota bacterium]
MSASLLPQGVSLAHPQCLYIDGAWAPPAAPGELELVCPNDEAVVGITAAAGEADVDHAVAAARRAFDSGPWPVLPVAERAAMLRNMARILRKRHPEMAIAFMAQTGALPATAARIIESGTTTLERYAAIGESYPWVQRQQSSLPGNVGVIVREPVGVVAAITPWNAPYAIMTQKIAPALIAGCTVIMKPSPETPLEAYMLAEAAAESGMPPGVLNLLPAHREVADYLVRQKGIDKISFTGSTAAGRRIASCAGERIARVTLELGGKSPAIVLDDYPVALAARNLARGVTMLTGQVCALLSRAIVPAHRYEEFAAAIAAEMRTVKIGRSADPGTEMGPLAMGRQRARVESYIEQGVAAGATLVTGGKRPQHLQRGFFVEPTLFTEVDTRSSIAQEEIFGPVLCLFAARDTDEAIQIANDSNYGLNGAVLTQDADAAYAVARRIRSGNVGQNGLKMDFNLPYGGFKQSGVGREGGVEGLSPYIETKALLLDSLPASLQ